MTRSVGDNVRRLRLEKKLTQQVLGKRAKCATSTLCEIEKGKIDPSARLLPRLARGLGVGVGDLFEGVA